MLRALAEPQRRRILTLVRDHELPAGEIAEHFDITAQAVSQHLRVLKDAALLPEHHQVVVPDIPGLGESAPVARLDVDTFEGWLTALVDQLALQQPTVVAHSLIGSLAAGFATRNTGVIGRLVIYAAPAIGAYRMPLRLRYVAIRFAIRPSAHNAERFDRFALLDLDATRRRDPDWYAAFDAYTRARARAPHVKRTMRQLISTASKRISDTDLANRRSGGTPGPSQTTRRRPQPTGATNRNILPCRSTVPAS